MPLYICLLVRLVILATAFTWWWWWWWPGRMRKLIPISHHRSAFAIRFYLPVCFWFSFWSRQTCWDAITEQSATFRSIRSQLVSHDKSFIFIFLCHICFYQIFWLIGFAIFFLIFICSSNELGYKEIKASNISQFFHNIFRLLNIG